MQTCLTKLKTCNETLDGCKGDATNSEKIGKSAKSKIEGFSTLELIMCGVGCLFLGLIVGYVIKLVTSRKENDEEEDENDSHENGAFEEDGSDAASPQEPS